MVHASEIAALDGIMIDDPSLNANEIAAKVWTLIGALDIVTCRSKIVSGTKTLHHLLPNLVAPIDNEHTKPFFGWDYNYMDGQNAFTKTFPYFWRIACEAAVSAYVGTAGKPWRTSRSKVIDNALVGYWIKHKKHGA